MLNLARDSDDNVIVRANENPILDTRGYIVEFEDGEHAELAANTITHSMYAQCDPDGYQYVMFDSIVDFRRSTTALCYADQKFPKAGGRSFMRRTTAGWHLCVQWKDNSTSWEKLSYLEKSHQLNAGSFIRPFERAYSAHSTGWDSFKSDNFSHEVEPSFH